MFVIAGVTGHVGSVVADQLLSRGQKIRVVVRTAAKGEAWSKRGAEVAVGSIEDAAFFAGALKGAAGLFVLLPPPPFSTTDFYASQRKASDAIVAAVKTSGVPYVVLLSSVGADLDEGNGPIKGLHYLERGLRATGTKLVAIRAGSFQENVGGVVGAAKGAGVYPNFTGSADLAVPMVATKDIGVLAASTLMEAPKNEVIDLQGPSYSARQIAEKLSKALGKPMQVVDVPPAGWVQAMTQGGFPPPFAEAFAEMYGGFAKGTIRPKGDRLVQGTTPIDEVIAKVV